MPAPAVVARQLFRQPGSNFGLSYALSLPSMHLPLARSRCQYQSVTLLDRMSLGLVGVRVDYWMAGLVVFLLELQPSPYYQ
jgi:hypothetical protein